MAGKLKEGFTVQELEKFGRRYRQEILFSLYFFLSMLSTCFFFGRWSICLATVGGIVGLWWARSIGEFGKRVFTFILQQEKVTEITFAVFGAILSLFLSPLSFFCLGAMGGVAIYRALSREESGEVIDVVGEEVGDEESSD